MPERLCLQCTIAPMSSDPLQGGLCDLCYAQFLEWLDACERLDRDRRSAAQLAAQNYPPEWVELP
jgi:hypothetical protein